MTKPARTLIQFCAAAALGAAMLPASANAVADSANALNSAKRTDERAVAHAAYLARVQKDKAIHHNAAATFMIALHSQCNGACITTH